MRKFGVATLALGLALGAGQAYAQARPGELVVGMTQFPSNLNPNIESMLAKSYVLAFTRRALTTYDDKWKAICLLCTELPTIENGRAKLVDLPDGKKGVAVTFSIHPDAKWGDGVPVTSKDFVFTWDVGKHPETGVANQSQFTDIVRIDVINDKTFTIVKNKVDYKFNELAAFQPLPEHIEKANFAVAKEYAKKSAYETQPTNPGLHYGPYKITEVALGSHIVLEPNPTWYGSEKAKYKRVVIKVIENTAALEANLLSGAIDYISGELGITIDQALAFQKRQGDKFAYNFKPGLIYEHIDLNLENPLLKDKRVRHGLLHAIDRNQLVEQLFEGKQPVAHTSINPLDTIFDQGVKKYPYDPKRAAELFDASGFNVMKDGYRHNAAGDRLRFELMTTAGNKTRELVQQFLQDQWKRVGVEIVIKNEPARVFFGETVRQRKYTGMAMFAWISSPESLPKTTFHSTGIPTAANNWAGQNYTGYNNPAMDKLIDTIEVELDAEKRLPLWAQFQNLYAEDLPVLPLYFRADNFIIPKWLKGLTPTGHQFGTSHWAELWVSGAN
jgi:peptide/nickel transport system substrate-binding protein